ncbi:MAG TPA: hypothetical protein VGF61_06040 [Candidatus Acidoferrum sp.]
MPQDAAIPFLLGVNYPWLNYAHDFGEGPWGHRGISAPENQSRVTQDFAEIRDSGATTVRWFLFGDGRAGFLTEEGIPRKPDAFLFKDVDAVLSLAANCDLKLCFSLIDFLWLQDHGGKRVGHANELMLQFAAGREAFLEHILIPLFREFRAHPALFAWEIANEPEWAIREFHRERSAKMHLADFRVFATEVAQAVHEFGEVPVTLGSARLQWVHAWHEIGLDFYQAHYYPATEGDTIANLGKQLAALPALDKPLVLGELPARDASADYSLEKALDECRDAGVHGAAVWRWTKPEETASDVAVGVVEPATLRAWADERRAREAGA